MTVEWDEFDTIDAETRALERPEDHLDTLRLWLRLLTSATLVEGEIRARLRERFDVTLPRFDLMAQLEKSPEGLTLSDVSRRMMVSNGNVTGLVERLVAQKLLKRYAHPTDRRTTYISLTEAGRKSFAERPVNIAHGSPICSAISARRTSRS